mgnify:CR=1 FL=1
MTPPKFEEGQRVRFKKEVRFTDLVIAEGELGTVDNAQMDFSLAMIRIKLDKPHTSEVLGTDGEPISHIMADRSDEIEPLEEVKVEDEVKFKAPNPHAICGHCEKRFDEHIYHDAEFHCPSSVIASVWTAEPSWADVGAMIANTDPELWTAFATEWKKANGHT